MTPRTVASTYECPFCGKKGISKTNDRFQTKDQKDMKRHILDHHPLIFIHSQFEPDQWELEASDWVSPVKCRHCGAMVDQQELLMHLIDSDHLNKALEELKVRE